MSQDCPDTAAGDRGDRRGLVSELAKAAGIMIELRRNIEVATLSASTLDAVRTEFAAEAFERKPADFLSVLRSTSDG